MNAPPGHEAMMEQLYPKGNPFLTGRAPIMDRRSFFASVAADKMRQAASAFDRHLTAKLQEFTGSNEFKEKHFGGTA